MPISAAVTPSTSPVRSAISRSSSTPAWETTPRPSALTLTRPRFRLRFIYEVPSCAVYLDPGKPKFPLQDRHFGLSTRRVAGIPVKDTG